MSLWNFVALKLVNALVDTIHFSDDKKQKQPKVEVQELERQLPPEIKFHADKDGVLYLDDFQKISEKVNEMYWNFILYADTTQIFPGNIMYVIRKYKATEQRPWDVYKYEPRVVTAVHQNGVNGGTEFYTYSHEIVKPQSITSGKDDFYVEGVEDTIYSPLTKRHAQLICAILNTQSRSVYQSHLSKIQQIQEVQENQK